MVKPTREEMQKIAQERLSEKRYNHCLRVADLAVELAQFHNVPSKIAYEAAIWHDLARELPTEAQLSLAMKSTVAMDEALEDNPLLYHGPAAQVLAHELGQDNEAVLDAIAWHTLAKPAMSKLAQIIYLADTLEPGRNWADAAKIRELAKKNLGEAMVETIKHSIAWIEHNGRRVHPSAYATLSYYENSLKK
ncbi:MAG: bis(5'-nucleosyl)-tetraphosphatase (symmetrical) YqeK [Clostridia bacterium]|nr:bis(5'-nucleosyl)-tetraphosphatase (symmetrical) YqeK [Clostridia bacterium]MDD4571933.1 bis(5'-nucleosyl)-tetraphosphatase (symmetrical) YqeK [Clostridia bacterium]